MSNLFKNKKFSLSVLVIVFVFIISIFFYFRLSQPQKISYPDVTAQKVSDSETITNCIPTFTHHFTDIATIDSIIPPVFRNSKGTMPTTLLNIKGNASLYMPTRGVLTQGSYYTEQGAEFYLWEIDIGCGITVVFDHVTEPVEKIKRLFSNTPRSDSNTNFFGTSLEMKDGELVGYTTGSVNAHNWNLAVYDSNEKNYLWESQEFKDLPKYYTQVCPFKFYDRQMAKAYEDKFILSFNDITVEKNLCAS